MEMSLDIPSRLQARGTKRRDPPATPDVPAAEMDATRLRRIAVGMSILTPTVFAVAMESTVMVTAAPAMLMVAPRGIEMEYFSSSSPSLSHSAIFTGMLAAELLVKKAIIPLSFMHLNTRGYGFCLIFKNTIIGLVTKATKAIHPTSTRMILP